MRPDVSREAYHHAQLMERPYPSNVFLRGFKYHFGDISAVNGEVFELKELEGFGTRPVFREWRYYLEYCSQETLIQLMIKYKAWGYHLPESFIWWTFFWLLQSCRSMSNHPERPFRSENISTFGLSWLNSFIIHNDISDGNVFLQSSGAKPFLSNMSRSSPPYDKYPMPKMADFGLSQTTNLDSWDNQAALLNRGTPPFQAPEKRGMKANEAQFDPFNPQYGGYPYRSDAKGQTYLNNKQHPVGPEANAWGVGFMAYLLMTLRSEQFVSDDIDDLLNDYFTMQDSWQPGVDKRRISQGLHLFHDVPTHFRQGSPEDYSPELKHLVLTCTKMQPQNRPSLGMLMNYVSQGIKMEQQRLHREFDGNADLISAATRIIFEPTQWNQTPGGPFHFGIDLTPGQPPEPGSETEAFWSDFQKYGNQLKDPDAPFLIPPKPNTYFGSVEGREVSDHDYITYMPMQCGDHFHCGERLPPGGRAQRYQFP